MTAAPAGVELWLVDVERAGPALTALEELTPRLSDDERERAAALGKSGEDWRLIRVALRVLLERAVGQTLRGLPFRTDPRGKPALPWPAGIEFSLSHTGRHGLIAIAREAVGVDLEQDRQVRFPADRQQAMLAAAGALAPVRSAGDASSAPIDILQAWVRLEAWSKARGSGVGALLHDLGIRGPTWTAHGIMTNFSDVAAERLRLEGFELHDLVLPPGLYGAIATRGPTMPPLVHEFPTDSTGLDSLLQEPLCSTPPSDAG